MFDYLKTLHRILLSQWWNKMASALDCKSPKMFLFIIFYLYIQILSLKVTRVMFLFYILQVDAF